MASLSIEKKHQLTHKKAKEAAQRVADDLKARFELDYVWRGNAIEFKRPGLSGKMEIGKDNVRLDAELGMILSLLKPKLEAEINKEFELRFGKGATA